MCISPLSGMIAARASAIGSRSTIPAASSGSPSSTSCRPITCLGADAAGQMPAAHWGYPLAALSEAGGGDRPRSDSLFRGIDAEMVGAGRSQCLRPARAGGLPAELQRARRASTPSARITAPARRGTSRPTRPISPPARRSHARRYLIWSDFYLVQRPRGDAQQPLDIWRRTFAPKITGIGVIVGPFRGGGKPRRDAGGAAGISEARLRRLAPLLEKLPQQSRRLALADAAIDLRRVVAGRLRGRSARRCRPRRPWVVGGEIDPPDAGEGDRGRAHGAGLERHIEIAAGEALVVQRLAGAADGEHFRMGRGIAQLPRAVARGGDDAAVPARSPPHRHLPARRGGAGLGEGHAHGICVGDRAGANRRYPSCFVFSLLPPLLSGSA